MLPVPTWAAMAVARAWKELIPCSCFPAPQGQVAEYLPHPLTKAAHLHKAGADAVKQAHTDEQEDQDIAGQIGIDVDYNGVQCRFQRL